MYSTNSADANPAIGPGIVDSVVLCPERVFNSKPEFYDPLP